jgi:hypothetical protein
MLVKHARVLQHALYLRAADEALELVAMVAIVAMVEVEAVVM